ncbi:MAG: polysaccharide deacetylase family protein [Acidobacteria bacterium]|nr:polysaccharide deacetylase family protein [Acidobacteriota bacterium]
MSTFLRTGTSVVLLYHRLGMVKFGSLVAGQYVAPRLFASQLDCLNSRGWEHSALHEIIDLDRSGREDQYGVTFDDGYLSVYEHACPALSARGMSATIYVVANSIGGINEWDKRAGDREERMMSAAQVRELADSGFEIGSHTLTHPRLTELNDTDLDEEIAGSKHKLEDLTGKEVRSFSYPYGDYDNRVLRAVVAAGYSSAVSTRLGVVKDGASVFEIPRVNVRWNAFGPLLMRKIHRAERSP